MLKVVKKSTIIISLLLCVFWVTLFSGCGENDIPTDIEFTRIVDCAKDLKNRIAKENEATNIYGDNYKFEIELTCSYTALNASYRIRIPYKVSNTGGNDLIDTAYYLGGSYMGTEIDYKYELYLSWEKERQNLFHIARINSTPDKTYSSSLITKALNK